MPTPAVQAEGEGHEDDATHDCGGDDRSTGLVSAGDRRGNDHNDGETDDIE